MAKQEMVVRNVLGKSKPLLIFFLIRNINEENGL